MPKLRTAGDCCDTADPELVTAVSAMHWGSLSWLLDNVLNLEVLELLLV